MSSEQNLWYEDDLAAHKAAVVTLTLRTETLGKPAYCEVFLHQAAPLVYVDDWSVPSEWLRGDPCVLWHAYVVFPSSVRGESHGGYRWL